MASLDNYRKYSSYKNALSNYITARDSAKRAAPVEEKTEKRSEPGIVGRLLATGGDLLGNVVTGAAKGVEGIADAAMGVVGGIGGIFDKGFQRDVRQAIEYDATGEWLGKHIDRWTESSFTNEGELGKILESVASGVGQMLPSVAVSLIPGLGQAASLATMGVSAAGSGTEEAFKDGADYGEGLLYGAVSGATEVATEKLFGGLTKGLTGKGVLDFSKEVADRGAKRVIKGAIEEGTEELVSHGVNPLAKAIYKGKDALKEYGTADYYKEGTRAFLAGAGTGMVYGGTVGKAINRAKGLNEDISAAVDANENIQKKLTRAQDNNRLTDSLEMQAAESRMQNLKSIEAKLQSTDAQTRERYIKNYRLGDTFNPDGSLKAEILAQESAENIIDSNGETRYNYSRKVPPQDDYATYAMQWAHSDKTLQGEQKFFYRKGSWVLLEKSDDGFVEMGNCTGKQRKFLSKEIQKHNEELHDGRTDERLRRGALLYKSVGGNDTRYIGNDVGQQAGNGRAGGLHFGEPGSDRAADNQGSYQDTWDEINYSRKSYSEELPKVNTSTKNKFDKRYYSVNLRGAEQQIASDLAQMSAETGEDIHVHSEELSDKAQENLTKFKKALTSMNEHRGESENYVNYVIVNPNSKFNGAERHGNTIYIAADALERDGIDGYAGTLFHEAEHTNEIKTKDGHVRTAADMDLLSYLEEDSDISTAAAARVFRDDYGISQDEYTAIVQKKNSGEALTPEEIKKLNTFESEYGATLAQYSLGKEYVIERLVRKNATVVERMAEAVAKAKRRLSGERSEYSLAQRHRMNKALSLYLKAAKAAGKHDLALRIMAMRDEDDEAVTLTDGSNTAENIENEAVRTTNGENMSVSGSDSDKTNYSLIGFADDGKKIYESNFPIGTPKAAKSERILNYIKDVWSKKPIRLVISNGDSSRVIFAKFDPNVDSSQNTPTDASKLAGGNRHGNHTEQRVTLDLADDYYEIASEAKYNYSKLETGKESNTHQNVKMWHYFVNEIYFAEYGEKEYRPYTVTINVKEKSDGDFVYSFNAEKELSTRQTLHAAVNTEKGANGELFVTSIPDSAEKVNSETKFSYKSPSGTSDVEVDTGEEIGYNLNSEKYSEQEYRAYGWARANDVLSAEENIKSRSAFAAATQKLAKYPRTKAGEYMIAVGDLVDNKIVYMSGKIDSPVITRVLEIDEYDETKLDEIRRRVYALERSGIQRQTGGLFTLHASVDSRHRYYGAGSDIQGQRYNNRLGIVGGGSGETASRIKEILFDDEGNVSEKTKFALKSSSETVAMSKGEAQKRKANYESDRVYSKADVTKVIESIKGFDSVKPKARNELIDDIWNGLNSRYSSTQRERYIEMMSNRAFWTVMQESGTALDTASQEEIYAIERDIHSTLKDVLEHGRPSIKSNFEAKFNASDAGYWKKQRDLAVERFKIEGQLMVALKKTRENKVGEFLKSHQYKSKDLRSTVEQLTRIDFRGNLNKSGTRGIIKKLSEWYVADNPMLKADKSEEGEFTYNRYDNNIAFLLSKIAGGEGELSNVELGELLTVVTYFNGFVEGYKRVRKNGKYIDAIPHAKKHVENIKKHAYVRVGWVDILFKSRFAQAFFRPKTLATRMDMGNEGFYNETLNEFRQGLIAAGEYEYQMMSKVEKFSKDNKKYFKELSKRKIMFDGNEMPVDVAMSLYMTTKREQARAALEESGFRYDNGKVVDYESHGENSSEVERIRSEVYRQLSDTDKAFIELAEKIFNEDCKNLKSKADIELHYYTNVLEGYYYPIYRAFIAKTVDSDFENLIKGAENQSFNKSTSDKANSFLRIMPLTEVLGRHVRGVSQYAGLSGAIRNYDITYNINVEENSPRPVTVASESEKVWKNGNKYFKELLSDMLGRSEKEGAFLSALRGSYATYQLGANPKTLATQMSSLFAATSELSYGSIVKGLTMDGSDVDKYCTLAKLRNANNDAILAQVNTNRPGLFNKQNRVTSMAHKAGEVLMTPIGWVDRFVVEKLFPACQVEVEAKGGAKVGTENNKVEAGKMLEQVIFNTQQNALATEKSAAMRSSNTIIKTTQMFGSDAMNTLGQSIDAAVEYAMLGALKKKTTDKAELDDIEKRRKAAGKRLGRSMGALVTSSIFMVVVACLFNALYHRIKDEDEDGTYWDEIGNDALVGFVGNMLGGIPILRDVFDSIGNGYAVDGYAYSMLNDAIESVTEVRKFAESAFSDQFDGRQAARTVRNVIYSFGQFFGIPMRNMYNITYSVLGFFPSVKYGIDSAFYEPAYSKDIKMAIEAGDETALSIVIETMTGERIGAVKSDKVMEELNSLTLKGYSVLPRAIANSVTVGEETITLTNTQKKQFKEIYGIANETLESLVKLKGYDKVSEEVRAKSIKMIYDIYYDLALENLTGVDSENKNVLFAEAIDIEELALIASQAKALTADKDKNGNIISGTKKAKVEKLIQAQQLTAAQKYMIMGYLGYTNKNGRAQVVAYINRLKLTKEEKALLLKYSGYE